MATKKRTTKKTSKQTIKQSSKTKVVKRKKRGKKPESALGDLLAELAKSENVKILTKEESDKLLDGLILNGCIAIPKGTKLPDGTVIDNSMHKPWTFPK